VAQPGRAVLQPPGRRIIEARLPLTLLRARRQKSACGVLMLHWLNQAPSHDEPGDQKRGAALSRIGEILRRAVRDVDTVARCDENHFMMLVEGPISRAALSEVATKILADCIRASEKLGDAGAFTLHVAIWHDSPREQTAVEVTDALKIRLHHMASGTRRPVQFVDSPLEPGSGAAEDGNRREDLLAKINAIEISHPPLARERGTS
jgi:GGDEF domain-containing protein